MSSTLLEQITTAEKEAKQRIEKSRADAANIIKQADEQGSLLFENAPANAEAALSALNESAKTEAQAIKQDAQQAYAQQTGALKRIDAEAVRQAASSIVNTVLK